jgi:hypothetical protein
MRRIQDLDTMTGIHCLTQEEADAIGELLIEAGYNYRSRWFTNTDACVFYIDGYAGLRWSEVNARAIYPASDFLGGDSIMNEFLNS